MRTCDDQQDAQHREKIKLRSHLAIAESLVHRLRDSVIPSSGFEAHVGVLVAIDEARGVERHRFHGEGLGGEARDLFRNGARVGLGRLGRTGPSRNATFIGGRGASGRRKRLESATD